MATAAPVADEGRHPHAAELPPQLLVQRDEVIRGRRHELLSFTLLVLELDVDGHLGLHDGAHQLGRGGIQPRPFGLQARHLDVERLAPLHQLEKLVLDGRLVAFDRLDVGLHGLQLAGSAHAPRV